MDLFLIRCATPTGATRSSGQSAWGFDHNRDFGTRNQVENRAFLPVLNEYPGLFYVDAHQQGTGYFFPPNEDPVHHEISRLLPRPHPGQDRPGAAGAVQRPVAEYLNYNRYDLFAPVFGDSVPSLLSGAAGMTYEKGRDEPYGKQVYDHYRAIDATVNVTARDKVELLAGWVAAVAGGRPAGRGLRAAAQQARLAAADTIEQQPGYPSAATTSRPAHAGDLARLLATSGARRRRLPPRHAGDGPRPRTSLAPPRTRSADAAGGNAVDPAGPAHEALDPGRPRRGPVHPVRLLLRRRHVVVLAGCAGMGGNGVLTKQMPSGNEDARDRRRRPSGPLLLPVARVRVRHRLDGRPRGSRSTCSTRAPRSSARGRRPSTAAGGTSRPAPRSSTVPRSSSSP